MKLLGINVSMTPQHNNVQIQVRSKLISRLDNVRRFALGAARRFIPSSIIGPPAFQVRATDDGWMVSERGSSLPLKVYSRKADAVKQARKMAREYNVEMDVFTRQGELQESRSY